MAGFSNGYLVVMATSEAEIGTSSSCALFAD